MHPTKSLNMYLIYVYSRYSFLHHTLQVRLVRSGMGSCIFWGGGGGVDRCIDRYLYRLSIDISVAMSVESRPIIGRVPVESWSSIGREPVEPLPICWRHSAARVYRSIVGRYFADGSCTFTGESFLRRIP